MARIAIITSEGEPKVLNAPDDATQEQITSELAKIGATRAEEPGFLGMGREQFPGALIPRTPAEIAITGASLALPMAGPIAAVAGRALPPALRALSTGVGLLPRAGRVAITGAAGAVGGALGEEGALQGALTGLITGAAGEVGAAGIERLNRLLFSRLIARQDARQIGRVVGEINETLGREIGPRATSQDLFRVLFRGRGNEVLRAAYNGSLDEVEASLTPGQNFALRNIALRLMRDPTIVANVPPGVTDPFSVIRAAIPVLSRRGFVRGGEAARGEVAMVAQMTRRELIEDVESTLTGDAKELFQEANRAFASGQALLDIFTQPKVFDPEKGALNVRALQSALQAGSKTARTLVKRVEGRLRPENLEKFLQTILRGGEPPAMDVPGSLGIRFGLGRGGAPGGFFFGLPQLPRFAGQPLRGGLAGLQAIQQPTPFTLGALFATRALREREEEEEEQ